MAKFKRGDYVEQWRGKMSQIIAIEIVNGEIRYCLDNDCGFWRERDLCLRTRKDYLNWLIGVCRDDIRELRNKIKMLKKGKYELYSSMVK